MQVSDVILTQISKCMMPGAIGVPGENIEVPYSSICNRTRWHWNFIIPVYCVKE